MSALLGLRFSAREKCSSALSFVTHDLEEAISLSDEVCVLSAGPASRIVGRYPVTLDRPRNLMDIKLDARFHALFATIWGDLRQEVLKAQGHDVLGSHEAPRAGEP